MAHVGMKHPVAQLLDATDTPTGAGFVIGKAIAFTGTPSNTDVTLYADDGVAETDKGLQNIGTSLNVDDLSLENQAKLLGHTYTAATDGDPTATPPVAATPEGIVVKNTDVAPYVRSGFYKRRRKNNITSFTAMLLKKVQHAMLTENASTKGETTEFQTATIEGTAYPLADGTVYEKKVFDTEAAAIAWLDEQCGISNN